MCRAGCGCNIELLPTSALVLVWHTSAIKIYCRLVRIQNNLRKKWIQLSYRNFSHLDQQSEKGVPDVVVTPSQVLWLGKGKYLSDNVALLPENWTTGYVRIP